MEYENTQVLNKDNIKYNKNIKLKFQNISFKVENKKYKKQLKKYENEIKKCDSENQINIIPKVDKELTILNDISGHIEDGELVALLGPSGGGKTTLLDILSNRKSTGKITGQLLYNGKEIQPDYKRNCSYVTQEDTLIATETVYETLKFYADLKLPELNEKEKVERVESIIRDIGLSDRINSKIGGVLPGGVLLKGLSGGEVRRVSIGCGLITNPNLIFLDEPTSGLDSVTALQIMKLLLNLTSKGVTVLCSIHQPKKEIFELFTKVMVIIKGRMIYSGSNIVDYFSRLGYICPSSDNPADFILDSAVKISQSNSFNSICEKWDLISNQSNENNHQESNENGADIFKQNENIKSIKFKYETSWLYQYWIILNRSWRGYCRNINSSFSRLKTASIIGLLFGACFANLHSNDQNVQKILGTLFFLINGLLLSPFAVIPLFNSLRVIFNQERASKMYHTFPYYLAMVTLEIVLEFFSTLLLTSITYGIAHLRWTPQHFFYSLLVYFAVHLIGNFLILTLVNLTSSPDHSFSYATAACAIYLLFSGFYVPTNQLPIAFGWLRWINPIFYAFSSLIINQFKDLPLDCVTSYDINLIKDLPDLIKESGITSIPICQFDSGNKVIEFYGIDYWSKGELLSIVFGFILLLFTISYLALHYLHKEKR